mmetsp:Transcript_55701/g.147778  ORF Transcript_55701/g.147778 Transcript_55701/m.147778 type:complete len:201 (-) Transcript_55701:261-863(-)
MSCAAPWFSVRTINSACSKAACSALGRARSAFCSATDAGTRTHASTPRKMFWSARPSAREQPGSSVVEVRRRPSLSMPRLSISGRCAKRRAATISQMTPARPRSSCSARMPEVVGGFCERPAARGKKHMLAALRSSPMRVGIVARRAASVATAGLRRTRARQYPSSPAACTRDSHGTVERQPAARRERRTRASSTSLRQI